MYPVRKKLGEHETLLSIDKARRVLGFARDMVMARAFGAGPVTDAFFVAFPSARDAVLAAVERVCGATPGS